MNFFEASDFAEGVEDLSRMVEYLQIIGAARVDRARREAAAVEKAPGGWGSETAAGTAGGWLTGWNHGPSEGEAGGEAKPKTEVKSGNEFDGVNRAGADDGAAAGRRSGGAFRTLPPPCLRRGCLLWLRWRMTGTGTRPSSCGRGCGSARPRPSAGSALAAELLPRPASAGRTLPPARQELAAAVAAGTVASRTATLITLSLDRVRHSCPARRPRPAWNTP